MISGIFHKGSGLGNQLHRYVATRVLALDKGVGFNMIAPELFKGSSFMNLEMTDKYYANGTVKLTAPYHVEEPSGKVIPHVTTKIWQEWNKNVYDPDINFVEDNTIIDGNFEDPKYFEHRLPEINEWLKTEPIKAEDDVCIIGFRGGEYKAIPELFLNHTYWRDAIKKMKEINPNIKFEIHTDDIWGASDYFSRLYDGHFLLDQNNTEIIRDIGINWRSMRYAKYAIIANSSFYVLPRLINSADAWPFPNSSLTIAPRYWNRYNVKEWQYPQNFYRQFTYI